MSRGMHDFLIEEEKDNDIIIDNSDNATITTRTAKTTKRIAIRTTVTPTTTTHIIFFGPHQIIGANTFARQGFLYVFLTFHRRFVWQ